MTIFKKAFWDYALERATKTVVQATITALTVGSVTGILQVAWIPLASAVALAGLMSLLTSVLAFSPTPSLGGLGSGIATVAPVPVLTAIVTPVTPAELTAPAAGVPPAAPVIPADPTPVYVPEVAAPTVLDPAAQPLA